MGSQEEETARALLLTVGRVLGPAVAKGTNLSLDSNFFSIGGNSLNSVSTVTSLKDLGYIVGEWLRRDGKRQGRVTNEWTMRERSDLKGKGMKSR